MVKPWATTTAFMFLVVTLVMVPAADRRANAEKPPPNRAGAQEPSGPGSKGGASLAEKQRREVKLTGQTGTSAYYAVAIQGKYAYTLNGSRLTLLDISIPTSPSLVGQTALSLTTTGRSIAAAGNFAYVGDGRGMHIIGTSNPSFPEETGFFAAPRPVVGIAVSGKYAYVATLDHGLRVVDVSNPSAPVEAGHLDMGSSALGVRLAGGHAYLATEDGLHILSLSDPAMPAEAGFFRTATKAHAVDVSGNRAYVAEAAGLRIIDVSNVASPASLGLYATRGAALGVLLSGQHVYLVEGSNALGRSTIAGGLRIVDVSNPANPTKLSQLDGSYFDNPLLAISGSYVYAASSYGLSIMDVSDPSNPTVALAYDKGIWIDAYRLAVAGGYAYLTTRYGLRVFDVTNPVAPTEVGIHRNVGANFLGGGVAIAGDYAYWAADQAGLLVIDVSDRSNPVKVGSYQMPGYPNTPVGYAEGVMLVGSYAYVADRISGIRIVDVSNPAKPVEAGHYDTPGMVRGMTFAGQYAVLTEDGSAAQPSFSGLRIVDVSDPTSPVSAGFYRSPGGSMGVTVSGNYAYLATGDQGLRIVDISNPAAPAEVGAFAAPKFARGVAVSGKYAYVLYDAGGLRVADVSDPSNPVEVGFNPLGNWWNWSVVVSGDLIFVAGGALSILWFAGSGPTTVIPNLTVSNVASRDNVYPGDALSYTVLMDNSGPTGIPVTIKDTIPVNTSFISGTLSAGADYSESLNSVLWSGVIPPGLSSLPVPSISFRVVVNDAVSGGGVTNSITVSGGRMTGMTGTSTTVFRRTFLPSISKGSVGW